MRKLVFNQFTLVFALVFASLPAWAAGGRCEQSFTTRSIARPASLKATFAHLARNGSLIQQYDARLKQRNLVIPNGGLCVSTCGVNVMHAVAAYAHPNAKNFVDKNADQIIEDIVNTVWQRYNRDAKAGLNFGYLALAMEELSEKVGIQFRSGLTIIENSESITEPMLQTDDDTIALVTVRTDNFSHAVVLTGFDPQTKKAYVNDPERPWEIHEATVTSSFDEKFGKPTLKLSNAVAGTQSHVGNIASILYIATTKSRIESRP